MPRCVVCDVCTTAPSLRVNQRSPGVEFMYDSNGGEVCKLCWYDTVFYEDIVDGLPEIGYEDFDERDGSREDTVPEVSPERTGQNQGQPSDISDT